MNEWMNQLNWNADGHIPAVIQDDQSGRVLTLCYMNADALAKTAAEKYVYVYRRSLGKLMKKGETSGHTQQVKSIEIDCEGKSLLIRIEQKVAACHKGYFSCYFGRVSDDGSICESEKRIFDPGKVYKSR